MRRVSGTFVGKSVAGALRLRGRSSGQAMPGLVVQRLIPGYLPAMLSQLSEGVVVITGTNGKTTTTKMVVELLRANGKRVLTNPTGSNLTRGIISSVSQQATPSGKLPFDIAIFELDEAYAKQFTAAVKPRVVLALNASRDQLDRFGEVDTVARLISETMLAATEQIIVNADDKRLSLEAQKSTVAVSYFGVSPSLLRFFPRDDELVSVTSPKTAASHQDLPLAVELLSFKGDTALYRLGKVKQESKLSVTGQHNFQNAAGALALLRVLLAELPSTTLVEQLASVGPAFGRGQVYTLKDGSSLQLNLVKNPASFRQGLASYVRPKTQMMIAINDAIADSRDMSWLWDIDFSSLQGRTVSVTSGRRAVDMALRLSYDGVAVSSIEPELGKALTKFASLSGDKVIFASYTAMLALHTQLERRAGKSI